MSDTPRDPGFDDGLVHAHDWAGEPARPRRAGDYPIAETSLLQTPSTVHQDEHVFAA